jgi:hypothetical protein
MHVFGNDDFPCFICEDCLLEEGLVILKELLNETQFKMLKEWMENKI